MYTVSCMRRRAHLLQEKLIYVFTNFPMRSIIFCLIIVLLTGVGFWRGIVRGQIEGETLPAPIPMMTEQPLTVSPTEDPTQPPVPAGDLLKGNWKFMPGFTKAKNGFRVHETKLAIVNQNGSLSEWNAPINVGTHLEDVTGDFAVDATLEGIQQATASIQLYGNLPTIADEFRIERESVQMIVENGKLTVRIWTGKSQIPLTQSFAFTPENVVHLTFARTLDNLFFTINGAQVGTLKEANIFSKKQIWFGLDAKNGDWMLTRLFVEKKNEGSFNISDGLGDKVQVHMDDGLQVLASRKRPEFLVGSAMALYPVVSNDSYQKVALDSAMFGSITPENDMKMINLQPERGIYTFQKADALTAIAKQNGLSIHGHALVFGEATPPWFNQLPVKTSVEKQEIETIMKDHITKVVSHFGERVKFWDVVNEPLSEDGNSFRTHKWYQAMGEEFMIKALDTAHVVNPDAMLFINEYGLEADGERWNFFINVIQKLKQQLQIKNIPVEKIGIGFQSHVFESGDKINTTVLKKHIQQLGQLGFKTRISEMNMYSDEGFDVQAREYADVFAACFSETNCIGWTGWIIWDGYDIWKEDDGSIQTGRDGLFDMNMKPRLSILKMQEVLK